MDWIQVEAFTGEVLRVWPEQLAAKLDQPAPEPNQSPAIWDLVIADMRDRDQVGRRRYGTPLQANNGRDALIDAYQEALDLVVYLRQAIEEREDARTKLEVMSAAAQRLRTGTSDASA